MKRKMISLLAAFLLLPSLSLFAVEIVSIEGSVRVSDGGAFSAAEVGQSLSTGAVISTGFSGRAVIRFADAEVVVEPVSFVELSTLIEEAGVRTTRIDLPVGRVQARVAAQESLTADFGVIGPVSTATVKGTDFAYDGVRLSVIEGDVAIENLLGQTHSVRAGQRSRAFRYSSIVSVETYFRRVAALD